MMDDKNFALLKEGASLYKSLFPFIKKGYPVYPMGMVRMSHKNGYAFGLTNEDKSEILLSVFNMSSDAESFTIDMERYGMTSCEVIYPTSFGGMDFDFNGKTIKVTASKGRTARLLRLKK